VGWSEPAIFGNFDRDTFGSLRVEADIITHDAATQCFNSFPVTLKYLTLNDREMPFYAKI